MPKEKSSETIISRAELAQAAQLFDAAFNSLDPFAPETTDAKDRFDDMATTLHAKAVAAGETLDYKSFKAALRTICRKYLQRNA